MSGSKDKSSDDVAGTAKKCQAIMETKQKLIEREEQGEKMVDVTFFFSFIFISWRLITLKYCSGFCHTLT